MKYPKGSLIILGILLGSIIGYFMNNLAQMTILGLLFGMIGEMEYKQNKEKNK